MDGFRVLLVVSMALLASEPAMAARTGDFGGLAICSRLHAMPRGYRPIQCNSGTPLAGDCRFLLTSQGVPVEYLIEYGVVVDKRVRLRAGSRKVGPFGIVRDEGRTSAARKIQASTGLSARYWADSEVEDAGYLQSTEVSCSRNSSYTIYVWFRHGGAESVSVSTLPAM